MENRVPARLTPAEGRKFALTVGGAFLVVTGVLLWRDHDTIASVTAGLGGTLVAAGLLIPGRLGPVYRAWMAFGLALSRITTPVFLGALFFGVLGPTGLLRRTFGRNPVIRPRGAATYWVDRPTARKSDLLRQF